MTSNYIWDYDLPHACIDTEEECDRITKDVHYEFVKDGGKIQYSHKICYSIRYWNGHGSYGDYFHKNMIIFSLVYFQASIIIIITTTTTTTTTTVVVIVVVVPAVVVVVVCWQWGEGGRGSGCHCCGCHYSHCDVVVMLVLVVVAVVMDVVATTMVMVALKFNT
jgi:hypothetical protein